MLQVRRFIPKSFRGWNNLENTENSKQRINTLNTNKENGNELQDVNLLFPMRSEEKLSETIDLITSILEPYHKEIEDLATRTDSSAPWQLNTSQQFDVADGKKGKYFRILERHSIDTVFLTVNRSVVHRMFDYNFYDYAANDCQELEDTSDFGKKKVTFLILTWNSTSVHTGHYWIHLTLGGELLLLETWPSGQSWIITWFHRTSSP